MIKVLHEKKVKVKSNHFSRNGYSDLKSLVIISEIISRRELEMVLQRRGMK